MPDRRVAVGMTAPAEMVPALSEALEDLGGAVSAFEMSPGGPWRVEVIAIPAEAVADVHALTALAAASTGDDPPALDVETLPDVDWVAENLKSFKPRRIGRFVIHPAHDRGLRRASDRAIRLEAGAAFGTGEHPTTLGCLLALERLAKRRRPLRQLDLGTGTAVLAMAMVHLWRQPVWGVDIDPVSVAVAAENAQVNGMAPWLRLRVGHSVARRPLGRDRQWDLIVANILARPLREMARDISAAVAPGGTLVLSGFLTWQARRVQLAYRRHGLLPMPHPLGRQTIDDWVTLVMHRPHGTMRPPNGYGHARDA